MNEHEEPVIKLTRTHVTIIVGIFIVIVVAVVGVILYVHQSNLAKQAQLQNQSQTQSNQPNCAHYLDFLHNGQPCPYNQ